MINAPGVESCLFNIENVCQVTLSQPITSSQSSQALNLMPTISTGVIFPS